MSRNHHDPGRSGRLDDALLDAVFTQSPVSLLLFDPQLRLLRANTAARLSRQFPVEHLVGRTLRQVLDAHDITDPQRLERAARSALDTGVPADMDFQVRSRTDPAAAAVVTASLFRLQDPAGTVVGLVASLNDVTEKARAEARLRVLNLATARIGTTLDLFRTADELCDLVVPELADTVAVDVFDSVLRGEAPAGDAVGENSTLRRVGFRARTDPRLQGVPVVGEADPYPSGTPYRDALSLVASQLIPRLSLDSDWLSPGQQRDARILAKGVHSMMVTPLQARGMALGMVSFYRWQNAAPFDRNDLALSEELAARTALCLDNARLYRREHAAAWILQHRLRQPEAPPTVAVEVAHTYLPAGAGGGWFDVLPLSGARVALVAGDAVQRMANAPAAIGELRAAIAALADLDLPPDDLLTRVHDLTSRPVPGAGEGDGAATATCLFAVYDPVNRLCSLARAGHPAPVLIHTNGETELLDAPQGPALGLGQPHYSVKERTLPEGTILLLYNTALLGNGSRSASELLERLRGVMPGPGTRLQETCDAIVEALAPPQSNQDAFLLLARTRTLDARHTAAWTLPNSPDVISTARRQSRTQLAAWGLSDDELADNTALIVSELVTNAVRYASGPVELRLIRDHALICEVTDDSSTAPQLRRAFDTDEGGRGLYITAQLTTRWGVRPSRRGKTVWAEQDLGRIQA